MPSVIIPTDRQSHSKGEMQRAHWKAADERKKLLFWKVETGSVSSNSISQESAVWLQKQWMYLPDMRLFN